MNISIDPNEFGDIINQAVTTAIERLHAERQADQAGKALLDKCQASKSMSVSISTLDRLIRDGELKAVKLSGRVLVSLSAIDEFVARKEAEGQKDMAWNDFTARCPALTELAGSVEQSRPPTTEPGYGRRWMEITAEVGRLVGPLGHEAYLIALDHMHHLYTDAALRASILASDSHEGEADD